MSDRPSSACSTLDDADLLTPGLVHEMRQPIMGIKAAMHFLARAMGKPLTELDDWQLIVSQLARLEEVLDTFRMLMNAGAFEALPFEATPVILRAASLLRFRTRALGPRFAVVVPEGGPVVLGAPSALLHALTNLLANALDAVEGAGDRGRVEVRLVRAPDAPGRLQLRVADNGCGVPPQLGERIFEPLFTTKRPGKGTGLGLYTALHMVRACGGVLQLLGDDAPLRQPWAVTEFSIELPLAARETT